MVSSDFWGLARYLVHLDQLFFQEEGFAISKTATGDMIWMVFISRSTNLVLL